MNIIIRNERPSDIEDITRITRAAFKLMPYSHQTEEFIIHALRNAGALTISLVAELDGEVVGHYACSPVLIDSRSCDWYGIGPISVEPSMQKKGIGSALMIEGLRKIKALGGKGCILVGDPEYYRRFGFRQMPQLTLEGVPEENFMGLPLADTPVSGKVEFHEGFTATEMPETV